MPRAGAMPVWHWNKHPVPCDANVDVHGHSAMLRLSSLGIVRASLLTGAVGAMILVIGVF